MKVLVTGIGGAIGCHLLAEILQETAWDVVGIDSFRHKGLTNRITEIMKGYPTEQHRVRIFTHDLNAPMGKLLKDKIGPIDYVLNLASDSHVSRSIEDPVPFIQNNVNLTLWMLEFAREIKPKAFLNFSTDEVYGPAAAGTAHAEWSPIIPSNPYSASKAAQEAIAISYWRTYGVPVIITNTMNNFGPMQDPEKYPAMVQKLVAGGKTVTIHGSAEQPGSRFYLHSRNTANAVLFILKLGEPTLHQDGRIDMPDRYNIVGEREIDNKELAAMIAGIMGKTLDYEFHDFHKARPGHDRRYALDGTKLADLGWTPPVDLETSLRQTIEWQAAHPEWLGEL